MTHAENAILSKLSRDRPARPSVLMIAKNVLGENLRVEHGGAYFLWQFGRWCPVKLDDVMRATNRKLKAEGRPQVTVNPFWVIQ